MFCEKCGAGLREDDRFCSRCGAPVVKVPSVDGADGEKTEQPYYDESLYRDEREIYYDEKLYRDDKKAYRDSFLEKKEEKSHALLVTVTVLLIMAVVAAAVVVLFFFMKKGNNTDGNVIEILSDAGQGQEADDGDNAIIFLTEAQGEGSQTGSDAAGGDAGASAASKDGSGIDGQNPVPDSGTSTADESASERETQTETSEDEKPYSAGNVIDTGYIEQILHDESSVTKAEVHVYDLKQNQEYATEGCDEPMYASAMICVPILYTAAVKLDQGAITLNDAIPYVNSIGGRGEAYPEEKEGQSFPLSYYLTTMMSYSDNNCMNCLIDYLGLDNINAACTSAGFGSVDIQRKIVAEVTDGKDNYVSAKDLAGMIRQLYQGKFQTLGREFIMKYFKIDSGDGYRTVIGLADNLPSGITFLNHNGKGDTRYNEAAVIADDTHQYIISVMCNGDYGFSYETAIEDISAYIYDKLTVQ